MTATDRPVPTRGQGAWHPRAVSDKIQRLPGQPAPRRDARLWSGLAFLWGAYYFAVVSIGRNPDYTRPVIWIGGGLVVYATLIAYWRRPCPLPKEGLILLGFSAWSLTGAFVLSDWPSFLVDWRMTFQMAVVVMCIGVVLRLSGATDFLYLAFLGSVVFNVLVGLDRISISSIASTSEHVRQAGLAGNPNALGFYSVIGLLGIGAIVGERRSRLIRAALMACAPLCLYGVVVSGSRGAFLALSLAIVLWPLMCFGRLFRSRPVAVAAVVLMGVVTFTVGDYVLNETYLGQRVRLTAEPDDRNSDTSFHLEVRKVGLKLFARSPIIGVGLGQFVEASGTDSYAHNEAIELLADTGLVGFVIYMSVYWILWRRLGRIRRHTIEPVLLYKTNFARMVLIVVVVSGLVFRPNFLGVDTIFLIAVLVGTGEYLQLHLGLPMRTVSAITGSRIRRATAECPLDWRQVVDSAAPPGPGFEAHHG